MQNRYARPSGSRDGRWLVWAERLLIGAGAAALIWCAVIVVDARLAQRAARESLQDAGRTTAAGAAPATAAPAVRQSGSRRTIPRGGAIAALSIPRIRLSAIVLNGSDERTLRRGPGHLEQTAFPGDHGNVVIAGHRDSHFWPLRHVKVGDEVFLDATTGQFRYQVTSIGVVGPQETSVIAPTADDVLTLITCYPFWVFGSAPDRFVVRAHAVGSRGPSTTPPEVAVAVALDRARPVADQDLVRDAVERFRAAYNDGSGAALRFQSCEITAGVQHATATCRSRGAAAGIRTFSLVKRAGGWAITSVTLRVPTAEPEAAAEP
jgi:sortase A